MNFQSGKLYIVTKNTLVSEYPPIYSDGKYRNSFKEFFQIEKNEIILVLNTKIFGSYYKSIEILYNNKIYYINFHPESYFGVNLNKSFCGLGN